MLQKSLISLIIRAVIPVKLSGYPQVRERARVAFHGVALALQCVAVFGYATMDLEATTTMRQMIDFKGLLFSAWNYTFQVIFMILALICDVVKLYMKNNPKEGETYKLMSRVAWARDFIFTACVIPFSCFTSIAFWITFTLNRDLIMPEDWDPVMTPFLNHSLHTNTMLVVMIELILATKKKPASHLPRMACMTGVTLVYYVCLLGTYFIYGEWVYLVYGLLSWKDRILLLTLCYLSANVFYFIGWFANDIIGILWRRSEDSIQKKTEINGNEDSLQPKTEINGNYKKTK